MATGGTAPYSGPPVMPGLAGAVNQRVSAAANAIRGNRGTRPAPGRKGPSKTPGKTPPSPPQHTPAKGPPAKPAAATYPYAAGVLNPGGIFSEAERNEIGKNITGAENAERAATRIPFQQKGSEIVNTEGNVRNSLNQINTGSQTYLQGLIAGAEGSAKTANNYAAENALSAQKQVETAGQNAQTNIGGIMAANVAATQQRGEADVQSMRTLAAAAAAQGAQGLNTAQARFATEASRNKAAENQALEKVAGKARNERMEIPIKLEAGKFAQERLQQQGAIAGAKLKQGAEGLNIKKGQLAVNAFTAKTRAAQGERKLNISVQELNRRWAETNNKAAQNAAHDQYLNAGLKDKEAVDQANIKFKEGELKSKWEANWIKQHPAGAGGTKPTGSVISKAFSEFGVALNAIEAAGAKASREHKASPDYNAVSQGLAKGYREVGIGGKPKAVKVPTVTNPWLIKAAVEAWTKHYVGPQTKAALGVQGIPTDIPWSESLKRA